MAREAVIWIRAIANGNLQSHTNSNTNFQDTAREKTYNQFEEKRTRVREEKEKEGGRKREEKSSSLLNLNFFLFCSFVLINSSSFVPCSVPFCYLTTFFCVLKHSSRRAGNKTRSRFHLHPHSQKAFASGALFPFERIMRQQKTNFSSFKTY